MKFWPTECGPKSAAQGSWEAALLAPSVSTTSTVITLHAVLLYPTCLGAWRWDSGTEAAHWMESLRKGGGGIFLQSENVVRRNRKAPLRWHQSCKYWHDTQGLLGGSHPGQEKVMKVVGVSSKCLIDVLINREEGSWCREEGAVKLLRKQRMKACSRFSIEMCCGSNSTARWGAWGWAKTAVRVCRGEVWVPHQTDVHLRHWVVNVAHLLQTGHGRGLGVV